MSPFDIHFMFLVIFMWAPIQACDSPSKGWMLPAESTTYVDINSTLYCGAEDIEDYTDLKFLLNGHKVPSSVYNDTTISFNIQEAISKPQKNPYIIECFKKTENICSNSIYIGYKPQNVVHFQCISYNLKSLVCTWDTPYNPIPTTYSPRYSPAGPSALKIIMKSCPDQKMPNSRNCTWTKLDYLWTDEPFFNFTMKSSNPLQPEGQIHLLPIINHYAIVIPNKLENVQIINVTSNAVNIFWSLPVLYSYPSQFVLVYNVAYREMAGWSSQSINKIDTSMINGKDFNVSFRMELPHANVPYEISVRARSSQANASEEKWWSEAAILKVTSLPDIPCSAPEAALGSFQVDDLRTDGNRIVTLLWSPIGPECKNGDQFQYVIEVLDSQGRFLYNKTTDGTELTEVLQAEQEYTFNIKSLNTEGASRNRTQIYLPKSSEKPTLPWRITKIQHNRNLVEINWEPKLLQNNNITSYTIFYCRKKSNHCKDKLYWMTVPNSQTSVNLTLVEVQDFDFAVASNQNNLTSGLIWSQCSINMTTGDTSLLNFTETTAVTASDITFQWQLPCIEKLGFIIGYNITYCSVVDSSLDSENPECSGLLHSLTVDNNVNQSTISHLNSSTTYKLQIGVMTQMQNNVWSKPLLQKTGQDTAVSSNEIIIIAVVSACAGLLVGVVIGIMMKYRQFYNKINRKKPRLPWENGITFEFNNNAEIFSTDKSTAIVQDCDCANIDRNSMLTMLTYDSRLPLTSVSSSGSSATEMHGECFGETIVRHSVPQHGENSDEMDQLRKQQVVNNSKFILNPKEESFYNTEDQTSLPDDKCRDDEEQNCLTADGSRKMDARNRDSVLDKSKHSNGFKEIGSSTKEVEQNPFPTLHVETDIQLVTNKSSSTPISNGYVIISQTNKTGFPHESREDGMKDVKYCTLSKGTKQNYVHLGEIPLPNNNEQMIMAKEEENHFSTVNQYAYVKQPGYHQEKVLDE